MDKNSIYKPLDASGTPFKSVDMKIPGGIKAKIMFIGWLLFAIYPVVEFNHCWIFSKKFEVNFIMFGYTHGRANVSEKGSIKSGASCRTKAGFKAAIPKSLAALNFTAAIRSDGATLIRDSNPQVTKIGINCPGSPFAGLMFSIAPAVRNIPCTEVYIWVGGEKG